MPAVITIKGIRDGLLVSVGDTEDWPDVCQTLMDRIRQAPDFFKGARLALALGTRPLPAAEIALLRDTLSGQGVSLWAILSDSPLTTAAAQTLGLNVALPTTTASARAANEPEIPPEEAAGDAVLVRRTLRSGRTVRYSGHVVVIGDVNPGAEIVAGGDIVVWGRLRGVAHAGAGGDPTAVVCALDLSPTQLRIAGIIAISPERKGEPRPEMARLKDGQIVAERWNSRK